MTISEVEAITARAEAAAEELQRLTEQAEYSGGPIADSGVINRFQASAYTDVPALCATAISAMKDREALVEASWKLTDRVRYMLPSIGMGRAPSIESARKAEALVEEVEAILARIRKEQTDG